MGFFLIYFFQYAIFFLFIACYERWPYRLSVRTPRFQCGKRGSTPRRVTVYNNIKLLFFIFNKNKEGNSLKKVESYPGGSTGNSYTNLDFYFGRYGEYHEFTFEVPGLYEEKAELDYMILKDVKPIKLRIR